MVINEVGSSQPARREPRGEAQQQLSTSRRSSSVPGEAARGRPHRRSEKAKADELKARFEQKRREKEERGGELPENNGSEEEDDDEERGEDEGRWGSGRPQEA